MLKNRDYMILHVDLFVRSMEIALDFYSQKLGFSVVDDAFLSGPMVRRVSAGNYDTVRLVLLRSSEVGAMIELQEFQPESALKKDASSHQPRKGGVSILVPNLRALMTTLTEHNLHPVSEVFRVKLPRSPACDGVFYEDPDGNDVEFLQIAPRASD